MFNANDTTQDAERNVNRVKELREMIDHNRLAFACQAERMERQHAELLMTLRGLLGDTADTYEALKHGTPAISLGQWRRLGTVRALLAKVDGQSSDAAQLTAAFNARDVRRLVGAEMRVKQSADMPAFFHGMRVKVLRQSDRTSGLTVEALEKRGPYNTGDKIHVAQSDLEPVT